MAKNSQQFKENLQEAGLWEDYCERYDALVNQGYSEKYAQATVTKEFKRAAEAAKNIKSRKKANNASRKGQGKVSDGNDEQGSPPSLSMPEDDSIFEGKTATEAENVRWVAENLVSNQVKPEDAPSKTAWALLQDCRMNQGFRLDFWKNMYMKLVSKGQIEGNEDEKGDFDGQPQVETLDQILQTRDRALSEAEAE